MRAGGGEIRSEFIQTHVPSAAQVRGGEGRAIGGEGAVLELLRDLQRKRGTAILLITHDLGIVNELADRIGVQPTFNLLGLVPLAALPFAFFMRDPPRSAAREAH